MNHADFYMQQKSLKVLNFVLFIFETNFHNRFKMSIFATDQKSNFDRESKKYDQSNDLSVLQLCQIYKIITA